MKTDYFISFVDLKVNKNIGVCMVQLDVRDSNAALNKAKELNLIPDCDGAMHTKTHGIEPEDNEENIEFNRFYTPEEMYALGYKKT